MLRIKKYVKVSDIDVAYELNQKKRNIIIGGMHWLKMGDRQVNTAIDLSDLGLDTIEETEDFFEIGCMTTLRQLEQHGGLDRYTGGAVKEAVKNIVGVQFRNTATVGGSFYGRYGFSDVLTAFMAMDTYVVCHNAGIVNIKEFSARKPDRDIIVKIIVKKTKLDMAYMAQRHARTDFPVLTCAVSFWAGVWHAAVGARPAKAEVVLGEYLDCGRDISEEDAEKFGEYVASRMSFGSNMRGSAEYRKKIASVLVKRAMLEAGRKR